MVPQGVQLLPPFLILCLIWFTPESPRWLVQKKRRQEAMQALNVIRPQRDIDSGITTAEVYAIELAVEESKGIDRTGRWTDLFKGNMLWRTWIAWSMFVFLQFTGVQFVNTFGATFYVAQGLANKSFTYIVAGNVLQIGSCLFSDHHVRLLGSTCIRNSGWFLLLYIPICRRRTWCDNRSDYDAEERRHCERHSDADLLKMERHKRIRDRC